MFVVIKFDRNENPMIKEKTQIAMLIDGDNAQAKYLSDIITETSKHGRIIIKRIYADWTNNTMKSWKNELNNNSIRPIQKFAYAKGKNSTDIALIIDAMDILHREEVDGFCLVSSDSDFTGLANRIRESGLFVIGIGKKQTPKPFINSCDIFTFTENFENKNKTTNKSIKIDVKIIREAFSIVSNENGVALLSEISGAVKKIDASFDPRTFGYKSYSKMFKDLKSDFELIYHDDKTTISVKDKKYT